MQRESANLDRQFKLIEQTYGNDHLDLVLVNGYVAKLLANARIVKFLTQHYAEILAEFEKIVDVKSAAVSRLRELECWGPGPISAGTAGDAALWGGSIAVVGMAANPLGAHRWGLAYFCQPSLPMALVDWVAIPVVG